MKKKIIMGVILIASLAGTFYGGWTLNKYLEQKDDDAVFSKSASFVEKIQQEKLDDAYAQLSEDVKASKSIDEFKKDFEVIKKDQLSPSVMQVYQSGNNYLINQDIVDSAGKSKKILVISVDKVDKEFKITSYLLN